MCSTEEIIRSSLLILSFHYRARQEIFVKSSLIGILVLATTMVYAPRAEADCDCVSIAADVVASVQGLAIKADNLYARGDYAAALELYIQGFTASRDAVFLYAQAQCQWHLGNAVDAEALFRQYLSMEGSLKYKARAEAAVRDIGAGVTTALGATARLGVDAVGGITGKLGGTVEGATGVGVGAGAALGGGIRKAAKPPKVAKGAAILLGVVAVAAVGALSVQGIHAGFSDEVDFDKRFGLSMGITGAVVGGTALYLWGLTAVAPAASGALPCAQNGKTRGIIAPVAYQDGGGITAAFSF
jgi:hypothetical protein